jgi:hypothetical protein
MPDSLLCYEKEEAESSAHAGEGQPVTTLLTGAALRAAVNDGGFIRNGSVDCIEGE